MNDYSAYWATAGDMDGDGHVDVMPNGMAGDGPFNMRNNAGELHVISGAELTGYLAPRPTAILEDGQSAVPSQISLTANHPNPFNSTTIIPFSLVADGVIDLSVYDLVGRHVQRLRSAWTKAGQHHVRWDGRATDGGWVAAGPYLVRLEMAGTILTHKMLLLK